MGNLEKVGARRKRGFEKEEVDQFPTLPDVESRSKRQVEENEEEIFQRSY